PETASGPAGAVGRGVAGVRVQPRRSRQGGGAAARSAASRAGHLGGGRGDLPGVQGRATALDAAEDRRVHSATAVLACFCGRRAYRDAAAGALFTELGAVRIAAR